MKKIVAALMTVVVAVIATGCGTVKPVNANTWAKDYYNQPNTANIASIEGDNVEFTIKGAKKIVLNTPVPPKTIIPRDPGVLDSISGLMGNVAPWAVMGMIGSRMASSPKTVEPTVVRPEVISIPAAP